MNRPSMPWEETVAVGLDGLRAHKMRSFLTALGIIFGVAAVISMLSIGEGAKREALRKYAGLGIHNVIVRQPPRSDTQLDQDRAQFSAGLNQADVAALRELVPWVRAISPQTERSTEAKAGDRHLETTVIGVEPSHFRILGLEAAAGRILRPVDMDEGSRVCVIGHEISRQLFDFDAGLGKMVKLGTHWYQVVGTLPPRAMMAETASQLAARDVNHDVYVPLATLQLRDPRPFPAPALDQITVEVESSQRIRPVSALVKRVMARRHMGVDDFTIVIPEELLREEQKEQRLFNAVLAAIASISLLVGGIGIMNIMLASVQERVKEIGLRRAVGASEADVVAQFLVEAALLSVGGGLVGVVVGIVMAHTIDLFADFTAAVSWQAITISFIVSLATGLIFGIYPARRAAALDPIEALRHE